jgi:restriction system protein
LHYKRRFQLLSCLATFFRLSSAIEHLAIHFNLTDTERQELLPSGKQARFANRVGWACTYLKKAGLLTYPVRGKFQITQRGLDTLAQKPPRIDIKYLKQFPEYLDFIGANTSSSAASETVQNAGIIPSVVQKFNSLSVP